VVLVLVPIRELVTQMQKVITSIGAFVTLKCHALLGGTSVGSDMRALSQSPQVVVGTPGRVSDMIKRRALDTSGLEMLIIDEADALLEGKSLDQVESIGQSLPPDVQLVITGTTLFENVFQWTSEKVRGRTEEPLQLRLERDAWMAPGIRNFFVNIEKEEWKFETLCDLYDTLTITQAIVFCNTRRKVDWLCEKMRKANFTVDAIHGDLQQTERDQTLISFRQGSIRVVITNDILARSLDVQQVSLVMNYDLPNSRELYLLRAGRCGRYGRRGTVISLATTADLQLLRDLETFYALLIDEMPANIAELI